MSIRFLARIYVLFGLVAACTSPKTTFVHIPMEVQPGNEGSAAEQNDAHEAPRQKGWGELIVFGRGPIYATSTPRQDKPQPSPMILEIALAGKQGGLSQYYARDAAATGETTYTIRGEAFAMNEFLRQGDDFPRRQSFRGDLYRGSPPSTGTPLLKGINLSVTKVLDASSWTTHASRSKANYFVFGNKRELFALPLQEGSASQATILSIWITEGITSLDAAALIASGAFMSISPELAASLDDAPTHYEFDANMAIKGQMSVVRVRKIRTLYTSRPSTNEQKGR